MKAIVTYHVCVLTETNIAVDFKLRQRRYHTHPMVTVLLLVAFFFMGQTNPCFSSQNFNRLTVDDGLAQSMVQAIEQDGQGYLWIGTAWGLSRFDGYAWKTFSVEQIKTNGILNESVSALHTDAAGRLWVGTSSGLSLYEPVTQSFKHWQTGPHGGDLLPGGIFTISSDRDGNIWAGGKSLIRLDPKSGELTRFQVDDGKPGHVWAVFEDSNGLLWLGLGQLDTEQGYAAGLFLLNATTGSLTSVPLPVEGDTARNPPITSITEDTEGRLWVGTWGSGMFVRDVVTGSFSPVTMDMDQSGKHVRQLLADDAGSVWMIIFGASDWYAQSQHSSLIEYKNGSTRLVSDVSDSSEVHTVMFSDQSGILWVGSSGSGVRYFDPLTTRFDLFDQSGANGMPIGSDFVRAIHADSADIFWVGTPAGLDKVDRSAGTVSHFKPGADDGTSKPLTRVESITRDGEGNLWIGTANGLALFNEFNDTFEFLQHDSKDDTSIGGNVVRDLLTDSRGQLWVATSGGGVNRFMREERKFERFLDLDGSYWNSVYTLIEASTGHIWLGTGEGIASINPESGQIQRYGIDTPVNEILQSVSINVIVESPTDQGIFWVGIEGHGLVRFDSNSGSTKRVRLTPDGGPDSVVTGLAIDADGKLWVSTLRGFFKHDPVTGSTLTYGVERGLQSLEFNRNAYHAGPDGRMYFGGISGLNTFYPSHIRDNPLPPRLVVSGLEITDRDGMSTSKLLELGTNGAIATLQLAPNQRDIQVDIAAIHFSNTELNRLSWKLEGYDTDWHQSTSPATANYTNLPYGDYSLHIIAASAYQQQMKQPLSFSFNIRQPFWTTAWFFSLCVLTGLCIMYLGFQTRVRVLKFRQKALREAVDDRTLDLNTALSTVEKQTEHLMELSEAKSQFVANVSHELRTPLTLMTNPLEDLRDGVFGKLSANARREIDAVVKNTHRLSHLVDQLLLISRLEDGQPVLSVCRQDLAAFVRGVATEFTPLAEHRRIRLKTRTPKNPVEVSFDSNLILRALSNLLENAFKYTPQGGQVLLALMENPDSETVTLEVRDNGDGIDHQHLPHIFERFYRGEQAGNETRPGTGIGLSIVKDLVEIHRGTIEVQSEPGFGSVFHIILSTATDAYDNVNVSDLSGSSDDTSIYQPIIVEHLLETELAEGPDTIMPSNLSPAGDEDQATVLVVDDNTEIRSLLKRQLESEYRVIEATDGIEAFELSKRSLPDVIISDLLMPRMDGAALCNAIKSDPALEFIPFVLLTAKSGIDSKLSALAGGCDDYLSKPFDKRELRARVSNLIKTRHRLKELAGDRAKLLVFRPLSADEDAGDTRFLRRVHSAINSNLTRDNFGVEELADAVHTSRIHLYRRLRDLCGKSPSELIMDTRLEAAAELLGSETGSISEVAYGVGFKSVSHFARRFRNKFELTPTAFRADAIKTAE